MINEERAIELYKKYGSMNRAALSLECSPHTLKKILKKNGVEIKRPKAEKLHMGNMRN